MSGKQIITDWVMVPLVLVVLIGGFAMNIKAVENKNADLAKKLDAVQAQLTAIKAAQKNVVVKTVTAPTDGDAAKKDDVKKPDASDTKKDDDGKKKKDDDEEADVPL